jgi:hypothetical protein
MLPLVEILPFVKKYAEGYQDLFSPEQFEHFRRYLTGLLVCENKTSTFAVNLNIDRATRTIIGIRTCQVHLCNDIGN